MTTEFKTPTDAYEEAREIYGERLDKLKVLEALRGDNVHMSYRRLYRKYHADTHRFWSWALWTSFKDGGRPISRRYFKTFEAMEQFVYHRTQK